MQLERVHHAQTSISIALRAIVESRRGRFDTAESWFNQALARAGDDDLQMIEIKYLYACDLMQRFRLDCIPLLQAHAHDENVRAHLRSRILSALGQALTIADRPDEARAAIDEALVIGSVVGRRRAAAAPARSRGIRLSRRTRERQLYALTAAEAAVAASAFSIATSAYSILYAMADAAEDPKAALGYLNLLRENGLKSGRLHFQSYFSPARSRSKPNRTIVLRSRARMRRSNPLKFTSTTRRRKKRCCRRRRCARRGAESSITRFICSRRRQRRKPFRIGRRCGMPRSHVRRSSAAIRGLRRSDRARTHRAGRGEPRTAIVPDARDC